jgi:hypothetical protein
LCRRDPDKRDLNRKRIGAARFPAGREPGGAHIKESAGYSTTFFGKMAHNKPCYDSVEDRMPSGDFLLGDVFLGCESSPFGFTAAQLQTLRTEPIAPLTVDYKTIIRGILHDTLKDPMSAVLEFSEPVRDMRLLQPFNGSSLHAVWRVDVNVNAKNSFGAYAGFSKSQFWFYNNQLIDKALSN